MTDTLAQTLLDAREGAAGRLGTDAFGGTAMVVGFEGESDKPDMTRVYLTPDCDTAYVEFPAVSTIHSQELPAETTRGFGGKSFFLPYGQKCIFNVATPVDASAVDVFALKENLSPVSMNGVHGGTERIDPATLIGIGTTAWGVAGQLGLQEPIKQGISTGIKKVGSWLGGLF